MTRPFFTWTHGFTCLALTVFCALGQTAELKIGQAAHYELAPNLEFMADPSAAMTLEDVLQPRAQAGFAPVPSTGSATNFGLTRSAIWLRVRLSVQPHTPPDWLLEVAYPPLDRIELFQRNAQGGWGRQIAGDLLPMAQKVIPHRNHVLPVVLRAGEVNDLYLRVESLGTVSVPTHLWRPAALWAQDQITYAALSLYFGLLVGLLLYNLLLYVSIRDMAYLIYVAFVAGMAVVQAALTGLGGQFLWPDLLWWNTVSPPAGMAIASTFGVQFARVFLNSAHRLPRLDWGLRLLVWSWVATLAAALALPYQFSSWMTTVLALVSVVLLVLAGSLSVARRHPGARYFLSAWAVLLVGVFTLFLHNTGVLPSNPVTANALLIGSAIEMVLLSFALGDRINSMRQEKEEAQATMVTEHALVEALSESQERYRDLLDEREVILQNSLVGIAFLTNEGRLRWFNAAMAQIFGVPGDSLMSMEPFYLSREQYLQVGIEVAAAVKKSEIYERELQVRKSDGTGIWISLSGKGVSTRDLSQGTVWVVMDITRRKELEAELLRTSSEREAILNSATVGIVLTHNRKIEWINDKFALMMGYSRESLLGKSTRIMLPDPETWKYFGTAVREILVTKGVYTCEQRLPKANGEWTWVEMGGSCVRPNEPETGVIWSILDISERKRSELEIREALEQQKVLNELRSRFVAMTSHEFRTPLASILLAGELLRDYGDRLPHTERTEILDGVAASVQRITRMMDRVLLLGKADAEMLEFKPKLLDLNALCQQLVDEARAEHPEAKCVILVDVAPQAAQGLFDEKLLRHIFGNLLSNALKYSSSGGTVRFSVQVLAGEFVLRVSDEGIGIPPDEIPHLFESFHRASNVGDIQGTGLGLAIVKTAVAKHGGRIEVESTPGQGSCFTVRLPAGGPVRPN